MAVTPVVNNFYVYKWQILLEKYFIGGSREIISYIDLEFQNSTRKILGVGGSLH